MKIITQTYWNNDEPIERTIFREQTVEDKQVEIWNKINDLTTQVEALRIDNQKIADNYTKETDKLVSMATILIIVTHTLLYMLK